MAPVVFILKYGGSGLIVRSKSSAALSILINRSTKSTALTTTLFREHSSAKLSSLKSSEPNVRISQSIVMFSSLCLILN